MGQRRGPRRLYAPLLAVSLLAPMMMAAPHARQEPTATPLPKPLVPVAASTLASNPETYYGEYVTATGAVEQILSPTIFSIDQDRTRSTPDAVLVIAPLLSAPVTPNGYVTVIGMVARFDADELARSAKDYTLDLAPDLAAKYRGRPVVVATSVINAAMVDLARRLPPPQTPADEAFDQTMKRIGPAFAALRQEIDGSNAVAVKTQAALLRQGFAEAEAFWKARNKSDAATWAHDAATLVDTIDRTASASHWDDVKGSATALGRACQSCHGAYRERLDDGTYRIKQ